MSQDTVGSYQDRGGVAMGPGRYTVEAVVLEGRRPSPRPIT
jgi:hypothetical protein